VTSEPGGTVQETSAIAAPTVPYILDWLKDMIVMGGKNVCRGEVEAVIADHPAVGGVGGLRRTRIRSGGELVAACVVLKADMSVTSGRRAVS
jgi:acyl-CoA synthetase (AMP-forming)/AMP-acid ligase II